MDRHALGRGWVVVLLAVALAALPMGGVVAHAHGPVTVERLGGASRFETAVAVSKATFARSYDVWLARGDLFPDALAASFPSGKTNGGGPLLLTPTDRLHPAARAEILRLRAERVFILGSSSAVSATVEAELRDLGLDTRRVSGRDRYDTAARAFALNPETFGVAFVVTGAAFADALAAGPLAFALARPILLTPPDRLHEDTEAALRSQGISEVVVVGGTGAVSEAVADEIRAICSASEPERCITVRRIGGRTRVETAALLADEFVESVGAPSHVNLARGDEFADAAAGGPHGGREEAPILLTVNPDHLGAATRLWLEEHAATVNGLHVLGTEGAISRKVVEAARAAATAQ